MKSRTIVYQMVFLTISIMSVVGLFVIKLSNDKSLVIEKSIREFNKTDNYYRKVGCYMNISNSKEENLILTMINPSLKSKYENAKYNMKNEFTHRFIYLSSLLKHEKEELDQVQQELEDTKQELSLYQNDEDKTNELNLKIDELSEKETAIKNEIKIRKEKMKKEIDSNIAFSEKEKSIMKLEADKEIS